MDVHIPLAESVTAVKSGDTKSNFFGDHGKHERHFIHGSTQLPELTLYVGHGYFNEFCTRVHKLLGNKVHYAFSLAYSIYPATTPDTPDNTHVITFKEGGLDDEEPLHQWYRPDSSDGISTIQPRDATPKPNRKVNWWEDTRPLSADQSKKSADF